MILFTVLLVMSTIAWIMNIDQSEADALYMFKTICSEVHESTMAGKVVIKYNNQMIVTTSNRTAIITTQMFGHVFENHLIATTTDDLVVAIVDEFFQCCGQKSKFEITY